MLQEPRRGCAIAPCPSGLGRGDGSPDRWMQPWVWVLTRLWPWYLWSGAPGAGPGLGAPVSSVRCWEVSHAGLSSLLCDRSPSWCHRSHPALWGNLGLVTGGREQSGARVTSGCVVDVPQVSPELCFLLRVPCGDPLPRALPLGKSWEGPREEAGGEGSGRRAGGQGQALAVTLSPVPLPSHLLTCHI